MREVLISIKPKWCELIASGEKTVEVRKSKPKFETPFKVYIYCKKDTTFAEKTLRGFDENGKAIYHKANKGKVIGEFVCDRIVKFENSLFDEALPETVARSCVPMYDLLVYLGKQDYGYGWHITDLKIYDKPRELSEFFLARHCFNYKNVDIVENAMGDYVTQYFNNSLCRSCKHYDNGLNWCEKIDRRKAITRPPQSYCYVEVQG